MDEKKQSHTKSLAEKPELPPLYWGLPFSLAIILALYNACSKGYTVLIETLLIIFITLLFFISYFAYKCFQNKQQMYNAYMEEEKRANTQNYLREDCENKMNDLLDEKIETLIPLVINHLSQNNVTRKG